MSIRWAPAFALALSATGALLQTGCETKAQTGALTGGAIGTATGALIGGNVAGAAIGGGVGALVGGVVGSSMDANDRARANTGTAQFTPLTAKEVQDWVLNNRVDKLNNLGPYSINANELTTLNAAYANQRFSASGPKLTTLQISYLYGVICYFQSTMNPICQEPPVLGSDAVQPASK